MAPCGGPSCSSSRVSGIVICWAVTASAAWCTCPAPARTSRTTYCATSASRDLNSGSGVLTSPDILTYAYMLVVGHMSPEHRDQFQKALHQSRPAPGFARARAYYDIAERVLSGRDEPPGAYLTYLGQSREETDPVTGERTRKSVPPGEPPRAGRHTRPSALPRQRAHPVGRHLRRAGHRPGYLAHAVDIEALAEPMPYLQGLASQGGGSLWRGCRRRRRGRCRTSRTWMPRGGTCDSAPCRCGSCAMLPPANLQSTLLSTPSRKRPPP